MSEIYNLSAQTSIAGSDLLAFYSLENGSSRKISFANLIAAVLAQVSTDGMVTQYAAPSTNAFTVTVGQPGQSTYLLLTPTGPFAAGTIRLPAGDACIDGQQLLVTTTQLVTALTIDPNGASINNGPTSLADGFFRLRFDGVLKTWFRIG